MNLHAAGPVDHVEVERRSAIEIIFEFLLATVWEILLQVVMEVAISFGFTSPAGSRQSWERTHRVLAGLGVVLVGALCGLITTIIWPERVVRAVPVPGISLVVSPLVTGAVMDRYGQWREGRGLFRSYICTFPGAALFAFTMALVRFFRVGL